MPEISLNGFRRTESYQGSHFQLLYEKLCIPKLVTWSDEEKGEILKFGLFFCNCTDEGIKRLGYRIITRYANLFSDYIPLYDITLNVGFIPISKFIESNYLNSADIDKSFFKTFQSSYKEIFRDGDKYLSEGQKALFDFCSGTDDALIVAPTSYGKSEMMVSKVVANLGKRNCIIVPSKALLAQTKRRLLSDERISSVAKRIITHPEMLKPNEISFVAVFTQERLLRLMERDSNFALDILLIDEAHNILEKGERGRLLSQVLLIAKHRQPSMELKFFTPFIADAKSIQTPYADYSIKSHKIQEYLKTERYYVFDVNTKTFGFYDQFVNNIIELPKPNVSEFEFIKQNRAQKNIIYLNKPRDVEDAAKRMGDLSSDFTTPSDADFLEACGAIADFIAPEYSLLKCLKKGVLYHHGKIPEIVRLYIEFIYSKYPQIPYIVTSSTLLEGVNIPAERMFLLSTKRGRALLSRSAFKNLIGRVCRFREIFADGEGNLKMLEPEIYVIKGQYVSNKHNPYAFLKSRAAYQPAEKDTDEIENILLIKNPTEANKEELRSAIEYIENIEVGVVEHHIDGHEIRYVTSEIGKACFHSNIYEFDIHLNEEILKANLEQISPIQKINEPKALLELLHNLFIKDVRYADQEEEFLRLRNPAARNFYTMVVDWKMRGATFKEMINSYMQYWQRKLESAQSEEDYKVYVGHSWGDTKLSPDDFLENYIDLRERNREQKINLAIVKIKDEQDFIDYKLMKFVDVMNDLELLEARFYDHLKYGSSDQKVICLLKNGISIDLAKCLLNRKYMDYLHFDFTDDSVQISRAALEVMKRENENKILLFELDFHAA